MLIVVYEFLVKESHHTEFERTWAIVTDAIRRTSNSLGSRLHRPVQQSGVSKEDPHTEKTKEAATTAPLKYIAYAQWPSIEVLDRGLQTHLFTLEEQQSLAIMRESCENIQTLYKLDVIDDRLVK